MLNFAIIIAIILIATGLAVAGSDGGYAAGGVPVFAICVAIAFVTQWLAFVPAWLARTEKYYDLVGSTTYIIAILVAVALSPVRDARSYLLFCLVLIWALRLGTYLYRRVLAAGSDRRFDDIKRDFGKYLVAWTTQGLWVSFSLAAALAAVTSATRQDLGAFAAIGAALWVLGFTIEAVADRQKREFRADANNRDRFINTGLWAWSRHPNYFGEIALWLGVAVIAIPNLNGWQWATLLSPLFVYLLLTRISGIPMLERYADDKWGGDEDYERYKALTPALLPRRPR
ncbi:MAG: DUF1295 domain-containing protein [Gammaproteobacteria bacterium]